MKTDIGDTSIIMDFDAQTVTTLNNRSKTVQRPEPQRPCCSRAERCVRED